MLKLETQNVAQLFVRGRPYAQSRARHAMVGGKMVTYSSNSKGLKKWRNQLEGDLRAARLSLGIGPMEGAVCVDVVFLVPTAQRDRWEKVCYTKPDKDNMEKVVLDAMERAEWFATSDSQVAAGQTTKVWCVPGQEGALVQIKRVRVKQKPASVEPAGDVMDWLMG